MGKRENKYERLKKSEYDETVTFSTNLGRLEANQHQSMESARRLFYNKRLIGKKVFCINYGGWYGHVKDMGAHVDEFMVERPNGKVFSVDINDIRQIEDIMDNSTKHTKDIFDLS
jgi:hypothetical protein